MNDGSIGFLHHLKPNCVAERLRTPASPMGVSIKKGKDCSCSKLSTFELSGNALPNSKVINLDIKTSFPTHP